ncbi:aldo/keto reductase [Phycicoccus endophyticus]|uniref:Aldo/keto reductase n=1 Tax=Phycicoccus endophyticus TaxID=1690220 RepID=A0A7G9R2R3_9MICO|nr:aldo/keto reductase [Phycicoccus endophyticus]NHI20353.1 aldo/keto reductase [Phycicoccus endophyticus]QNN49888.1 aldo/keto reductase [Phycicoccus endophyticus]GGL29904.1 aldo/keto reductase [Phycicoccus endophyticus]
MQYRTLGDTGVRVSSLALGAMNFGPIGDTTQEEASAIVDAALEAGVTLVDTADFYGAGVSEEMVGRALAGRRDDVVLATKAGLPFGEDPLHRGASRRWLTRALEASLRRLGTDHVDLFQVHRWDPLTSDEETLAALTDLQRAGKVRYVGTSKYPAYRMVEAQWTARERHLTRFVTEQPNYSLLGRGVEADVLPVAERYRLGVLCFSPLAGGWLTGAIREGREVSTRRSGVAWLADRFDLSLPVNRAKLAAVEQLAAVADQAGLTLIELALGFVTAHRGVTSALIGPRTLEHLRSQLAAADTVLTPDVLDAVDAVVPPGTEIAPAEANFTPPSLADAALRRRGAGA